MSRPYPRRRRRPGRRPPARRSAYLRSATGPYRSGFTGMGFAGFYRGLLPGLQGREKRLFFNKISLGIVAGFALGGLFLGAQLGVPGALVGLPLGVTVGFSYVVRAGFFRA